MLSFSAAAVLAVLGQASLSGSSPAATEETVLLDFGATWCGPCRMMEPTVDRLLAAGHPVRKINIDQRRDLAKQHNVRGVPCFVMLVNGQEVDRVVGATSFARLEQMVMKATSVAQQAPGQAVAGTPRGTPFPAERGSSPLNRERQLAQGRQSRPHTGQPASQQPGVRPTQLRDDRSPSQRAMAASVRITVEDDKGHSYGSGTIVDARQGKALVLTCGHIFRDSKGQGRISVDLFQDERVVPVDGKLVSYNLERDVALVVIEPPGEVTAVPVAGDDFRATRGERVFTIGCNRGQEPSLQESRVSAIDKYLGPPNIEVAGQPVDGRSGGGLFTSDGRVIGVCNAADPTDDEGLYAAIGSIYAELHSAGLAHLFREGRDQRIAQNQRDSRAPGPAKTGPLRTNPARPSPSAIAGNSENRFAGGVGSRGADRLSRDEDRLLEILRSGTKPAEVICIFGGKNGANGEREVVVIEQPSAYLLDQLAREFSDQQRSARHTTTLDR